MKKNKIIQFSLLIAAIILFFFTYYSNDKDKTVEIDKDILIGEDDNLTEEISTIIKNANYVGTDNRGTFFELNANLAKVFKDKPNISNMKIVDAVISLVDGRKIYIKSDYAIYDKSTNNTNFMGNVLVTESSNKITCDNLDLIMSENLIKVFNNVTYDGEKGLIRSDVVHIDILKNEVILFMKNSNDKVKVKYKN